MLVGVGCNAGRSFITLSLPFAAFASEVPLGSAKYIDPGLETNLLK